MTQSLVEPPAVSAAAVSWTPVISSLERVTDAITATAVALPVAASSRADARDVESARAALVDLADAVVAGRLPATSGLPEAGPLAGVGDEIAAARGALASHVRGSRAPRAEAGRTRSGPAGRRRS